MFIINIFSLFLNLLFPLVLLVSYEIEYIAADPRGCAAYWRWASFLLLIGMLLVVALDSFVKQRFQAHQEQHVDAEERKQPHDQRDGHFDDECVAVFIFALAPRAELLFFAF